MPGKKLAAGTPDNGTPGKKVKVGAKNCDLSKAWIPPNSFTSIFVGVSEVQPGKSLVGKSDGLGTIWDFIVYPSGMNQTDNGYFSFHIPIAENSSVRVRICINAHTEGMEDIVRSLDGKSRTAAKVMDRASFLSHYTKNNVLCVQCTVTGMEALIFAVVPQFSEIRKAYQDGISTDFCICAADTAFPVHKLILTISSSVFKSMFESGMIESTSNQLKIDDFTPEAVKLFLDLIYGVDHEFSDIGQELRLETLRLCDKYDTRSGVSRLTEDLMSSLTVENCLGMLVQTETSIVFDQLRACTLKFIKDNFIKVMARAH